MIEDVDKLLGPNWGKINGEDHPDTTIASAATKAERERCAKIADSFKPGFCGDDKDTDRWDLADQIARSIRRPVSSPSNHKEN